jgi:hypothetical protein
MVAWLFGPATVVPYEAATCLQLLFVLPLVVSAAWWLDDSRSARPRAYANRWLRGACGLLVAMLGYAITRWLGPTVYRMLIPSSFGDGAGLMRSAAWLSLGQVGLLVWQGATWKKMRQPRLALAAIVSALLLYVFVTSLGLRGVFYATAAGVFLESLLALSERPKLRDLPFRP